MNPFVNRQIGLKLVLQSVILVLAYSFGGAETLAEMPGEERERMVRLREEISRHDELYFVQGAPEISDAAYDRLRTELTELEARHAETPEQVPRTVVPSGDDQSGRFRSTAHTVPMLSLRKVHDVGELVAFHRETIEALEAETLDYWIEPKVDGVAVSLVYIDGELKHILTRGDGSEGADITESVSKLPGIPRKLKTGGLPPELIELRGEAYISMEAFKRINEERGALGLKRYSTPRNLAAGTVRSSDPGLAAERGLRIVLFGWGGCESKELCPDTYTSFRSMVRGWGFHVLEESEFLTGAAELRATVNAMENERTEWPYESDGLVLKINSTKSREQMGRNSTGPLWAVAYKFPPQRGETTLAGISWQVGRTGVLAPVAHVNPVILKGRKISRVSLYNEHFIRRGDYRIGDTVVVELSGDVIPSLDGVVAANRTSEIKPYVFPSICPGCDEGLRTDPPIRCDNPQCPEQLKHRILHFAKVLGIQGITRSIANKLVEAKAIRELPDIYTMDFDVLRAAGISDEAVANQIQQGLRDSRKAPLREKILALGVPGFGPAKAQALAETIREEGWSRVDRVICEGLEAFAAVWGPLSLLD